MRFRPSASLLLTSLTFVGVALLQAQQPPATTALSTTNVPAKGGDIVITALGHASVQLEQGGKVIIVDPVTKQADLSKAKPADLILVTDIHPDHFDAAAIAKLRKPGAPVVTPPSVAAMKTIPDPTVMANREMRANELAPAGIRVISVPAYNIERGPAPGQLYHPRERGQGYLLSISDKLVYVAGDTECVPALDLVLRKPQVEVAFLPMNLPFTMTPAEAAACAKGFVPKIVIPYHFMGQKPEEFAAALKGEPIEVRILNWYPKS
jgi:L-ascorbate metabolism protein UlaG (beta-lactamase superfamily)